MVVARQVHANNFSTRPLHGASRGRLYGEHVAINASILLNAAETGQAPVIAARNRLDIGATNMTNDEHALIFSAGDMAIGGTLDANLHATGSATSFNNNSATIEALGSLDLAAAEIRNTNAHLRTAVVSTESDLIEEYAGAGASKHYLKGTPGVYTYKDESDHLGIQFLRHSRMVENISQYVRFLFDAVILQVRFEMFERFHDQVLSLNLQT